MPISPPKCRTCGVIEWNHTCRGALKDARKLAKAKPPEKPKTRFGSGTRAR